MPYFLSFKYNIANLKLALTFQLNLIPVPVESKLQLGFCGKPGGTRGKIIKVLHNDNTQHCSDWGFHALVR